MITSLLEQSLHYERIAAAEYRKARKDAGRAEHFYASARQQHRLSLKSNFPFASDCARNAVVFRACADMYLQASFNATEHARFYVGLARDYREMSA